MIVEASTEKAGKAEAEGTFQVRLYMCAYYNTEAKTKNYIVLPFLVPINHD